MTMARPNQEAPFPRWESSTLVGLEREYLRRPRWHKTNAYRVKHNGSHLVVKDTSQMPWPLRITWGRMLLAKEANTYRRLRGLKGTPRLVARLGTYALVMEYVEGLPLRQETVPHIPPDFFQRLDELVTQLHARRVLHLDLGQRKNILVQPDGSPVIIDFGSALGNGLPKPVFWILHRLLGWIDRRGVLMHQVRYGSQPLDEKARRQLKWANRIRALWVFNRPTRPRRF